MTLAEGITLEEIDKLYAAGSIDSATSVALRKCLVMGVLVAQGEYVPRNTEVNARRICAIPVTREQARHNIAMRERPQLPGWFGPFTWPKWLARLTAP